MTDKEYTIQLDNYSQGKRYIYKCIVILTIQLLNKYAYITTIFE